MHKIRVVVSYELGVDLSTQTGRDFWQAEDKHQALHSVNRMLKSGNIKPEDLALCPYKVKYTEIMEEE